MFERFTNHARHVVVLSQEEARRLQHNYIGTEHILLGLLGEPAGAAFRVLDSHGMTLERAAGETGVSRAALRTWYRTGQIPSRLVDGPHGPQRLVPLALVAARAEASPRLRHSAERRLADEAQLELLRHRVDQLELRLAALERRLPSETVPPEA